MMMMRIKFIRFLKLAMLVSLIFLSFKGFISFALSHLGLNILSPLISAISAVISKILITLYLYPRHDKKDINIIELLYKCLLIFIIVIFVVSGIQIFKEFIAQLRSTQLNYNELICIYELFFTLLTIVFSEETVHENGVKVINLNMNNSSSSSSSNNPSSSSSNNPSSERSRSRSRPVKHSIYYMLDLSGPNDSSFNNPSSSNNPPSPYNSLSNRPSLIDRLNRMGNPFFDVQPGEKFRVIPQKINYQNDQATSSNVSGKNLINTRLEQDSRGQTNQNPWLNPAIGSIRKDIDELKLVTKTVEDAIKKIEVGIKDSGFERVEYNSTYGALFVRGGENPSNSARRFLNQCLNEDYKKIEGFSHEIMRIKANLDAHMAPIPEEHESLRLANQSIYNKETTKIMEKERHYFASFNTMSGVEQEINRNSVSGSESESE
jgi:hypothetical protein